MPALDDERWMKRALELARRGEGLAHPNPMVGAVLVKNGRVVGEGFHTYDGVKHAEIIALEKAGAKARGATLYINLEPCCHTGRTGPCTKALIAASVRRVVAAMKDPNPAVSGRGLAQLRRAGVKVDTGLREAEARILNQAFAKWIRIGLPFVTQKIAMTLDFKIAGPKRRGHSIAWITSKQSREEVQRMRHASDALLTGIGTVLADDPRLTDRTGLPRRRRLLRVVLDSHLRLPLRSKLVGSSRGDLLVFTTATPNSARARRLRKAGVEVVQVRNHKGRPDLKAVLKELGRRSIQSVMLEAGAALNQAAVRADIVDKFVHFVAQRVMGAGPGIEPPQVQFLNNPQLRDVAFRRCGPDLIVEGYLRNVYGNH